MVKEEYQKWYYAHIEHLVGAHDDTRCDEYWDETDWYNSCGVSNAEEEAKHDA